jgi:murein DD-endopeptidase MepM/ murein hydrolase activator NlpD
MNLYEYNQKTLQYEKIKKGKILKTPIILTIIITSILINIFYLIFNTPEELILKNKNEQLIYNYNYLNDKIDSGFIELYRLKEKEINIYNNVILNKNNQNQGGMDLNISDSTNIYDLLNNKNNVLTKNTNILNNNFNSIFNELYLEINIPSILPINPNDSFNIASGFGFRLHPILNEIKFHTGVDFGDKLGSDVYSTAHGIVEFIEYNDTGYGNQILINHQFYKTRYAHLDTILVNKNDTLYRGELIGKVGNTGLSTSPHCHYEVLDNNYTPLDPSKFYSLENNKSNQFLLEILKIN